MALYFSGLDRIIAATVYLVSSGFSIVFSRARVTALNRQEPSLGILIYSKFAPNYVSIIKFSPFFIPASLNEISFISIDFGGKPFLIVIDSAPSYSQSSFTNSSNLEHFVTC